MTIAVEDPGNIRQNPDYRAVMTHFHRGEWDEAINLLKRLAQQYPSDPGIRQLLAEAQFKASLDRQSNIKAKRWAYPWRTTILRAAFLIAMVVLIWQGFLIVRNGIRPILEGAQIRNAQADMLGQADAYLKAGDWDQAEKLYLQLLAEVPNHEQAQEGLETIGVERQLYRLYQTGVAAQAEGDCDRALSIYTEILLQRSAYADVTERIAQCKRSGDITQLLADAKTFAKLGLLDSAIEQYRQVRALDPNAERELVSDQLLTLHLSRGRQLLEPDPATMRLALDHFRDALRESPTDPEVIRERDLAQGYLTGQEAHAQGAWDRAASALRPVYAEKADYLGGVIPPMLYDAYVGLGDRHRNDGDCALAYDLFRQAAELPVADKTVALARMEATSACLTPTPTPTSTAPPTVTPVPSATATATPTPRPLNLFRGKIVYKSDSPDRPGFYVIDPDGNNREFVGSLNDRSLRAEFQSLLERYRLSPDGSQRIYVDNVDQRAQIVIAHNEDKWPARPLTRLTGIAYDPSWSPDGSLVVFVTQENESDDIWVIRPDSSGQKSLMRNDWEWDKHPSWSPDSTRITFWSNRWGMKQLFVMDATGQNVENISNVPWDEYDPIWIR